MAILRVPVTISLDEESFKVYSKLKPGERSQKIREFLKSMQPPKPEKETIIDLFSEKEYVKEEKKNQKTISAIMSSGTYSHENELKSVSAAQVRGSSKKEVRALRLLYKEKRKETQKMVEAINREHKGEHLENPKNQKYRLARMQWQKEPLRKQALYERQTHGGWRDET